MRILYFGSSKFSADVLRGLFEAGLCVVGVVSQPDKPFGRKGELYKNPVASLAQEKGLPLYQPHSLKKLDILKQFRDLDFDFGVVVAYGKILPQRILDTARVCYLNGHASDLPRWRGAAPMERALMAGDLVSAMCIMKMEVGLDEGEVFSREEIPLNGLWLSELEQKMRDSCIRQMIFVLSNFSSFSSVAQSESGVLYAHKITRFDSFVDPCRDSVYQLQRKLRALHRSYGICFEVDGKKWLVYDARFLEKKSEKPGLVMKESKSLKIYLVDGEMEILDIQIEGKKRMPVLDFLPGLRLKEQTIAKFPGEKHGSS